MSDEVLPPYSNNSDRLPSYSRLSEAPVSKLLPNHYVTRSRKMALDLGQRYLTTPVPAFGREGLVEGHVWIQSFESVEKIRVTLTGTIVSYFLEFGVPNRPSVKRLTHQTHEIWSAKDNTPNSGKESRSLAFALVIPEHVDRTQNSEHPLPLPPSASISMCDACTHVAYSVRVDMIRKGWHSDDSVKSEILYLPRTKIRYSQPFLPLPNSEKLRPILLSEWAVSFVPRTSKAPLTSPKSAPGKQQTQPNESLPQSLRDDIVVRLGLPSGLRYPAGRQIFWSVAFIFAKPGSSIRSGRNSHMSTAGMDDREVHALISGVSLRLVCVSTIVVRGLASRRERVVAQGEVSDVLPDMRTESGERKILIRGHVLAGEEEKEMSWGVKGFGSVVYEIRVTVKPNESAGPDAPAWEYSERIMIMSHEADGDLHNAGVPALLLPGATRAPVSLSLMGQ